ncbi:MAG: methyltransferase domain-containing protein [Planctomycetes bacterium]|nr:methyltransferase domain-containing protein [Planctomycetota bacterium]
MTLNEDKLHEFMGKMVGDMGAAMSGALIVLGDRLGLFKALAKEGPLDSAGLAACTGVLERYAREWLAAMAASGYIAVDTNTLKYSMSPEQAAVFADESSPVFVPGGYEVVGSVYRDEPKIAEAFRNGKGFGWHEHSQCLFRGTERFFKAGYAANLVANWIPALEGVHEKLDRGARVADIGCGHGASTRILAKAFPNSEFHGFDYHPDSIGHARAAALAENLDGRLQFHTASAKDFPGRDYDLIAFFDCLHDMGDPIGAARHVHQALKPDGTWMIVEPFAHDHLEQNLNPIGRIYYAASTMICTPASLSQEVGLGLGAQAGEETLRRVVMEGGFTRFRRATETPFNLILEARP